MHPTGFSVCPSELITQDQDSHLSRSRKGTFYFIIILSVVYLLSGHLQLISVRVIDEEDKRLSYAPAAPSYFLPHSFLS